jgi:small subunit ribosomal protein S17
MAKSIIGRVTSNSANKTIVITLQSRKTHPLYRKQYTVSSRFMAHDEKNQAEVGDLVEIIECRPISAKKHFRLNKIIEKPKLKDSSLEPVNSQDKGKASSKKSKEQE